MASKKRGTLYVGVTSNLLRRVAEHVTGDVAGFTARYGVKLLVYFEATSGIEGAILREKQIKRWNRDWKINLIERDNPDWSDLAVRLLKS
jgi:putative endonuclease